MTRNTPSAVVGCWNASHRGRGTCGSVQAGPDAAEVVATLCQAAESSRLPCDVAVKGGCMGTGATCRPGTGGPGAYASHEQCNGGSPCTGRLCFLILWHHHGGDGAAPAATGRGEARMSVYRCVRVPCRGPVPLMWAPPMTPACTLFVVAQMCRSGDN